MKKLFLIIIFISVISSFYFSVAKQFKIMEVFNDAVTVVVNRHYFQPYIEDVNTVFYKDKSVIMFSANDAFNNLEATEKFFMLESFQLHMAHMAKSLNLPSKFSENIRISAKWKQDRYEYFRPQDLDKPQYIYNGKMVGKGLEKLLVKNKNKNKENVEAESEHILDYTIRLYKVITKNGTDYVPGMDNWLIRDAVIDKFLISKDEYEAIINNHINACKRGPG
ncbi:hypothetical protein [Bacillus testis]|uniref:hypothetical protein n=1 Tax=Bacillus testis TaxID=1622072 RepID=UPI000A43822D|nr:hypothetical protein [Bacillus testis]